jgi:transmembrane sensor
LAASEQAILRTAAEWYATLMAEDAAAQDRAQWRAWLALSPRHRHAWDEIQAIGQQLQPLRGSAAQQQAAATALGALHAGRPQRQRRAALRGMAGLGLAAWLAWRYTPLQRTVVAGLADHHTHVGETREIPLPDHSRVWLASASALDVRYTNTERRLTLQEGEVLVQAMAEPAHRSLSLQSCHGQMQALGTRFGARLLDNAVQLSVYEGAVRVITAHSGQSVTFNAGQRARFDGWRISGTEPAPDTGAAWTQGLLVAQDMPLAQLAAELERYHPGRIRVAPQIAQLRVLGTYPLQKTDVALELLAQSLPIRVRHILPWWIALEAA